MMRNVFQDDFERPSDLFGAGGSSRMVSTTTTIVNGQKHTVTKITDENGTRVVEDYGNGQQRVTVNGKPVDSREALPNQQHSALPKPQKRQTPYLQQAYHQQPSMGYNRDQSANRPLTSGKIRNVSYSKLTVVYMIVDLDREYGHVYDAEDNRVRHKSSLHELCSRIFCCF
jgi:hypothetical protein